MRANANHHIPRRCRHACICTSNASIQASVKGTFDKGSYEFSLSPLQAVALLQFNDAFLPKTFTDVSSALGLDADVAKRVLHSLACVKFKVLTKIPEGTSVSATDTFIANASFSCPLRKVRIPMASLEENAQSTKAVDEGR